jgi:hypothetical protein
MTRPAWLDGTYADAIRVVAERALYSRSVGGLVKNAGFFSNPVDSPERVEAVNKAQAARQELGILGADEKGLNAALKNMAAGKSSPGGTREKMEDAVPGAYTQFRSLVPSFASAGTAMQQGRFGQAAKQFDILGIKNLIPFSGHFSPLTAAAALGAHQLASRGPSNVLHGLEDLIRTNRFSSYLPQGFRDWLQERHHGRLGEFLRGPLPAGVDTSHLTEGQHVTLRQARQAATPMRVGDYVDPFTMETTRAFEPPNRDIPEVTLGRSRRPGREVHPQDIPVQLAERLRRSVPRAEAAAKDAKWYQIVRRLGGWGPSLAFFAPLAAREWLGAGYRSGQKPIRELVEANRVLNKKR